MRFAARAWSVYSTVRGHSTLRYLGYAAVIAVAILAGAVVTSLTVDFGPHIRSVAEREGSRRLERPIHVGRLSIHLLRGRVLVEDFSIEGRRPGDRPFFTAKRISLSLDWSTALARRPRITVTSVELTDWQMLVEKWADGHSFPRFIRDEERDAGSDEDSQRRFATTVKYVEASRGQFSYEDHEIPWSVVAPNLELSITNLPKYHGEATFSGGTIKIQDHIPMWATMKARFTIDGSQLRMDRVDLDTDGASSVAVGNVDMAQWPEMRYDVESRVQFPRMREIFFRNESWALAGDGDFSGVFHLFKGGHDLAGAFTSEMAGVNAYRFPSVRGSLHWTPTRFEVTDASSRLYGGDARFGFSIDPLGSKERRPVARFDASYADVDLSQVSDVFAFPGVRFAGAASGQNFLEWPLGRFVENQGEGSATVVPPPGIDSLPARPSRGRIDSLGEWVPRDPLAPLPVYLPIAGEVDYGFDPGGVEIGPGRFATERTEVTFEGSTAWGDDSDLRFHVTSGDWQESDQVLAGLLTTFGSPTRPVAFAGRGEFDGTMTGAIRRPRVEGLFIGEDLFAWDTRWGSGSAQIVVENSYVTLRNGSVRLDDSEFQADGLFSLGYPRRDGGEEIDARFRVSRRDVDGLRHAFGIDEYPVSGYLTGDFRLTGRYEAPVGFGAMTIEEGVAYGEPFQRGTASLRFDGTGVRLDGITIGKSTGTVSGAAFVGWNSTYSFNADGRQIPVEVVAAFSYPQAQPTGLIEFTAGGSGTLDLPQYDVKFRVNDLFVASEDVGQVTGTLALRGGDLSGEIEIASPRLAVSGTGRIALTAQLDSELTFRFHESSLDPYVRLFVPQFSPFTTAVAGGSIRVSGELADVDQLVVDVTVDNLEMKLFDYEIRNAAPIRLALDRHVVQVEDLQLVGEDTRLRIGGSIALHDQQIALQAAGDANLGILQGFFRNVRGSGQAELLAAVNGPLYEPEFSGSVTIRSGRIRHLSLPSSLDAINGVVRFDSQGVGLDEVVATMGGGRVQFGGRIGLDGYLPGELNVIARGDNVQLRYPEGVRSAVDADLSLRGNFKAPTLGGTITVRNATWSRRVDPTGGLIDFGGGVASGSGEGGRGEGVATAPLRFDLQVLIPSTLRIENNLARLVASADLQLRGTYDQPTLYGRAEVDRGEILFEGRRYLVTRGAIEFTNPTRIEPFFDVEAETRVRVPGQTYRVIVRAAGTMAQMLLDLSSEPPLPAADVLMLLFSERRTQGPGDAELQARLNPTQRQADLLTARATQMLASPLSSEVGRVVEQTFGVDSFQVSPSLFDPYSQSTTRTSINPSARVTIGKRISDRIYLTFSRSLRASLNDQILLLEYDESDRLSWVVSRNEDDQTYAIEVRVRHSF